MSNGHFYPVAEIFLINVKLVETSSLEAIFPLMVKTLLDSIPYTLHNLVYGILTLDSFVCADRGKTFESQFGNAVLGRRRIERRESLLTAVMKASELATNESEVEHITTVTIKNVN